MGTSLPSVLRERASLQPDDTALTFIDYDQDWDGVAVTLTWSQLYKRASSVAQELRRHGSAGDRALIVAPQGMDYIVAFLAALQSGLIAVPLAGFADERAGVVLRDTSPVVVLTTTESNLWGAGSGHTTFRHERGVSGCRSPGMTSTPGGRRSAMTPR